MTKTMKTLIAALSIATMAACGGASSTNETTMHHNGAHETQASSSGATNVVAPGAAQIGDTTLCPVNGETFTVTDSSPHVEYNGKTYYLCCDHCVAPFQANPAQYVQGGDTTAE